MINSQLELLEAALGETGEEACVGTGEEACVRIGEEGTGEEVDWEEACVGNGEGRRGTVGTGGGMCRGRGGEDMM